MPVTDPDAIRARCRAYLPSWSELGTDKISVERIVDGLSNQLFKVQADIEDGITCVLFRVYGKDVASLYDQELEFRIFKMLASYQIAPRLYANGDGWRIEEWHNSVTLKTSYMRNPSILAQVASQVARLHKLASRADFPPDILALPPASLGRIEAWAGSCARTAADITEPAWLGHLAELGLPEMLDERVWLRQFLTDADPKTRGAGLDIVFSHNDIQENNILQTHYGLRLIDFEYSNMDYQAFDIANFFCECTIDYTFDRPPFYAHCESDFPTESEQRLFCSIYLSEYLQSSVQPNDSAVTVLVERVRRFVLLSHYLWALWAVIRAPQGSKASEFDFMLYARARWGSYKRNKAALAAAVDSPEVPDAKLETRAFEGH